MLEQKVEAEHALAQHTEILTSPGIGKQHLNVVGKGPWSLDWLTHTPISEGGIAFTAPCLFENYENVKCHEQQHPLSINKSNNRTKGGAAKRSVGFLKRVARMPENDRREIIKVLKKQDLKRKTKVTDKSKSAAASKNSTR